MGGWTWLLALVVGLALVQLYVYRRLGAGTEGPGAGHEPDGGWVYLDGGVEGPPDAGDAAGDGRRCPRCGTENEDDPAFTYCRNCLAQVG